MKKRKYLFVLMSTVLSLGFLFGCNGVDEDEPDPSEEPSEQTEDDAQ
ncbi:MAG TPA: hypothetical protein VNM45_09305 [Bacillus sp. (in: firmicutes)]|nr:hypothetical protein [Bacillus sp. (in: firmicutes)]